MNIWSEPRFSHRNGYIEGSYSGILSHPAVDIHNFIRKRQKPDAASGYQSAAATRYHLLIILS